MGKFRKFIVELHRILGAVLGILFLVWFLSGIVLIYHSFPSVSVHDRTAYMFDITSCLPSIDSICDSDSFDAVELKNNGHENVFTIDGCELNVKGESSEVVGVEEIIRMNSIRWGDGHEIVACDTLHNLNQWIPFSSYRKDLPIYRFRYCGNDGLELFISSVTGKVLQKTIKNQRFWAWLGAIPHWIYFTWLRENVDLWKFVVKVLAALGIFMIVGGICCGFLFYKRRGKSKFTPYKKIMYKFHHVMGLFFGFFMLTWVFSGYMSLAEVPDWLVSVERRVDINGVLSSGRCKLSEYNLDYRKLLSHYNNVKKLEWGKWINIPVYYVHTVNEKYVVDARVDDISPLLITEQMVNTLISEVYGTNVDYSLSKINSYEMGYVSRKRKLPLPMYKVSIENSDGDVLYINPSGGDCKFANSNMRLRNFLYKGLHSLSFPWLLKNEILWHVVMWILLVGGAFVSFTGIYVAYKYIKRLKL